jgi:hypothetical protein
LSGTLQGGELQQYQRNILDQRPAGHAPVDTQV